MSNGVQSSMLLGNRLASAILNRQGEFTWCTSRAREWLEIYLEECGRGAQSRVQEWIGRVASGNQGCNQSGSRICLSRPGATLHLHVTGKTEDGEFLILLEEYREPDYSRIAAAGAMASAVRQDSRRRSWPGWSQLMAAISAARPTLRKA